jgi:hypothetical protein
MPFYDPEEARKFLADGGDEAEELDLRGLSLDEALRRVDTAIAPVGPDRPARLRISIDPAIPGGGETLFQPLARHLLAARRARRILHFLPIRSDGGAGFLVERPMTERTGRG